jgi:hypothetical protein
MNYIAGPGPKGKGMNINKYRGLCRQLVNACIDPQLTPTRKYVLLALVDHVNDREGYTAWPAFNRLAAMVGTNRRTAIRAINVGRKLGIVERVYKGGKRGLGGTSNRYRFCINVVSGQQWKEVTGETPLKGAKEVTGETPKRCQARPERGDWPVTLSSQEHLNNSLREDDASSSSALRAVVVGVAASLTSSDNPISERAGGPVKGMGEEARVPAVPSDTPKPLPPRKQTPEEFRAEMEARGLKMAASRWGRGRDIPRSQWPSPALPEPAAGPAESEKPKVWSTPTITEVFGAERDRILMELAPQYLDLCEAIKTADPLQMD